ncbi:DUF5776 domain-containing protein [Levilactobacillus lanxiensis]|uniref:DUF5776 domain-containing protein n=1 Tax=Levilactobacillus lanxiensis TaxID=2799568 RepID=A0ABW4D199_9LACO|nr:DUF5776 domain-containing protein [Levilactobacillus lanxiensis]
MTRKVIKKILFSVGLLLVVCSFGFFKGPGTVVAQADSNSRYIYDMYFESENDSTNRVWVDGRSGGDSTNINPESFQDSDVNGVTYNDFYKKLFSEQFNSSYTMYDIVNTYFDYSNNVINQDTALSKLSKMFKDPDMAPDADTFQFNVEQYISMFPKASVDMEKTREEAAKPIVPEPAADPSTAGYDYRIPDFNIYIVNNDYQMTIKYVLPDGTAAHADDVVTGYAGKTPIMITSPSVDEYVPDQKEVKINFAKEGKYVTTVHYVKPGSQTGTTNASDQSSLIANDTATVKVGQSVDAATFDAKATDSSGNSIPVTVDTSTANLQKPGTYSVVLKAANGKTKTVSLIVTAGAMSDIDAPKQSVIYGLKTLYLYQTPTFNKSQRLVKYSKTTRTNRPMFVVTGYDYSKSGLLRYKVKDVNHTSKTAGMTGYVTARKGFVGSAYYQKSVKQIKVLSKKGVNLYQNVNLTKRTKHVKQGKVLNIVGLKQHNLTTRFVLSNGQYLTANKKSVIAIK